MQLEYGYFKNTCRWNTAISKTHASGIRLFQKQGAFRFTAFVNYLFPAEMNQRFISAGNEQLFLGGCDCELSSGRTYTPQRQLTVRSPRALLPTVLEFGDLRTNPARHREIQQKYQKGLEPEQKYQKFESCTALTTMQRRSPLQGAVECTLYNEIMSM